MGQSLCKNCRGINQSTINMGLSEKTVATMKATIPALKAQGTTITSRFYSMLMEENPDLKSFFNASHLRPEMDGTPSPQARSLAGALLAYASNSDNLGALSEAVERISEKHVSLDVTEEQYQVVGSCLLRSMEEVLGPETESLDEILACWKDAYFFLADLFIKTENAKKAANSKKIGGWIGYKEMVVLKKEPESEDVCSIYFGFADPDSKVPDDFKPGQYLSVKLPKEACKDFANDMVRNYSLSCSPGEGHFRCSIKRQQSQGQGQGPDGTISNFFHDHVDVGTKVMVGMPCGHFTLGKVDPGETLVFVAAGIGITPLMSMLEWLSASAGNGQQQASTGCKVILIQVVRTPGQHPMKDKADAIVGKGLDKFCVFYTKTSGDNDRAPKNASVVKTGRPSASDIRDIVGDNPKAAQFYFCGPPGFMADFSKILKDLGVEEANQHHEFFGPEP